MARWSLAVGRWRLGRRAGLAPRRFQQLPQTVSRQAHQFRQPLHQQLEIHTGRNGVQQRSCQRDQARLAVGVRQVDLLAQMRQQIFRQRLRAGEPLFKARATLLAHQRIGILAVGQEQEADLAAFARFGQHILQRAPCRATPGAIAVEAEHQFIDQLEGAPQMFGRGGGAERGHRVLHAGLVESHHVHIAFDDQQAFQLDARQPHFVQAVEFASLMEQFGFR